MPWGHDKGRGEIAADLDLAAGLEDSTTPSTLFERVSSPGATAARAAVAGSSR